MENQVVMIDPMFEKIMTSYNNEKLAKSTEEIISKDPELYAYSINKLRGCMTFANCSKKDFNKDADINIDDFKRFLSGKELKELFFNCGYYLMIENLPFRSNGSSFYAHLNEDAISDMIDNDHYVLHIYLDGITMSNIDQKERNLNKKRYDEFINKNKRRKKANNRVNKSTILWDCLPGNECGSRYHYSSRFKPIKGKLLRCYMNKYLHYNIDKHIENIKDNEKYCFFKYTNDSIIVYLYDDVKFLTDKH